LVRIEPFASEVEKKGLEIHRDGKSFVVLYDPGGMPHYLGSSEIRDGWLGKNE